MEIDLEALLAFARQVAWDKQRVLAEKDVAFIRFLAEVAGRHQYSMALLRTRVQWYVTYNASRAGLIPSPTPAPTAAAPAPTPPTA
ncbi:MAG: hypothetical protein WDZ31_10225 [Phycisphaeraceae bacterium]